MRLNTQYSIVNNILIAIFTLVLYQKSCTKKGRKNDGKPEEKQNFRGVCEVCEDFASSFKHYGAKVCFSCRAFFRRVAHGNKIPTLENCNRITSDIGKCPVKKSTRHLCWWVLDNLVWGPIGGLGTRRLDNPKLHSANYWVHMGDIVDVWDFGFDGFDLIVIFQNLSKSSVLLKSFTT